MGGREGAPLIETRAKSRANQSLWCFFNSPQTLILNLHGGDGQGCRHLGEGREKGLPAVWMGASYIE